MFTLTSLVRKILPSSNCYTKEMRLFEIQCSLWSQIYCLLSKFYEISIDIDHETRCNDIYSRTDCEQVWTYFGCISTLLNDMARTSLIWDTMLDIPEKYWTLKVCSKSSENIVNVAMLEAYQCNQKWLAYIT